MSERRRRYVTALYGFDAVVRRVPSRRWDDPSPCPGWTARSVVGHVVAGTRMFASELGAGDPATGTEDEVAGSDPLATWTATRDLILAALDEPGVLEREIDSPFGRMTVERFAGIFAVDPLTHTWDLARATGVDPALDPELCERGIRQLTRAGDLVRGPGLYGPALPVPDGADPATRFVAVTGRTPT